MKFYSLTSDIQDKKYKNSDIRTHTHAHKCAERLTICNYGRVVSGLVKKKIDSIPTLELSLNDTADTVP